jgi:ribulose-phosphate 3-epimerase
MSHPIQIAPSILSADFGDLNAEIASIDAHVEWISVDVMDGHFVPNITVGSPVLKWLKSKNPFEAHLMISHPEQYIEDFAKAGARMISVHFEAMEDLGVNEDEMNEGGEGSELDPKSRSVAVILKRIRALGCLSSLAIKPATTVEQIQAYLPLMDGAVVMSVEPGFGGQKFMMSALPKVKMLRELDEKRMAKNPELDPLVIIVDGGINAETAPLAIKAGASVLISGSFIFKAENRLAAIASLRG